ncbi:hypothetical protein C8A06_0005 [Microbacteriaceae bacterium MWH-Ta3]|nr:hypothetical protein C8A06_0005 [Microbacteriaceae bacterium MWH-Ta3]
MARHDWKEDPWLDPLEFWHFASMVFVYRSVHEFVEHLVVFPLKFGQTLTDAAQTYLRNYLSSDKELKCVGSQEFDGHDMLIHSGQIAFMTLRDPSVGIEEYAALFTD